MRPRKYTPGPVDGTELTFRAYDDEAPAYGFFDCSCGGEKRTRLQYVFNGYPGKQKGDRTNTCGDKSVHGDKRWKGDEVRYNSAHRRTVRLRGSASEHPCALCGDVSSGNQWAYRHSIGSPLAQPSGDDEGRPYSTNPGDYWCLCRRHHSRWDSKVKPEVISGAHVALAMAYDPYGDGEERS